MSFNYYKQIRIVSDKNIYAIPVSPRYVLTTAHSVNKKSPGHYVIVVGDHDLTTGSDTIYSELYRISRFIVHPQYQSIGQNSFENNDIALMMTSTDIQYNRGVGPACLPYRFQSNLMIGSFVEAAGWGSLFFGGGSPNQLKKVSLQVISNTDCSVRRGGENVQTSKMCTFSPPRDTCTGDSGGGLYLRQDRLFVVGLISTGGVCGSNIPSLNTRITSFIPWIESVVGANLVCRK